MCNEACIEFAATSLTQEDVAGKRVLEVGSLDYNGSVRSAVTEMRPRSYVGVDLEPGRGVDLVCDAANLTKEFGAESQDVVITTEMLEHVPDWRIVVSNLKRVLASGGVLVLTTRSKGYPYHAAPHDYWRFELDDMVRIFSDLTIERLEPDPLMPGVFLEARRPADFEEMDLTDVELHSMVVGRRVRRLTLPHRLWFGVGRHYHSSRVVVFVKRLVPRPLKDWLTAWFPRLRARS